MKKRFVSIFVLVAVICGMVGVAYAAGVWQCQKCGQQVTIRGNSTPSSFGCGGKFENRHIWQRLR